MSATALPELAAVSPIRRKGGDPLLSWVSRMPAGSVAMARADQVA
jgi:hypothetical protein